jgi:hypothetical protein
MRGPGAGTCLVQGATANAITVFLVLLVWMLYRPTPDDVFMLMMVLPIYLLLWGIPGAIVGFVLWLAGSLRKRKLGLLTRGLVGIIVPILITLLLGSAFDLGWPVLFIPLAIFGVAILPAALMSGSRLNPMRTVVLGMEQAPPLHDFGRAFSFFPAMVLRFGSTLGLLETMVYFVNSSSGAQQDWQLRGDGFPEAILAFLYFCVTAMVSFGLPRKQFVLIAALLGNAPILLWVSDPPRVFSGGTEYLTGLVGLFVGSWFLFALGRSLAVELTHPRAFRTLPVTFLEIRVRHALNWW